MRVKLTEEEKKARKNAACRAWRAKTKDKRAAYSAAYYAENKDRKLAISAAYRAKNKEKIIASREARYADPAWREKEKLRKCKQRKTQEYKLYHAAYRAKNKEKIRQYHANLRKEKGDLLNKRAMEIYYEKWVEKRSIRHDYFHNKRSINQKISHAIRSRTASAIKNQYTAKSKKTTTLLGCSIAHARQHLESQFLPGMTWENYSLHGWHIDHIKPCSSFDLTDPEQQKACFHYTNLQPLWATDNMSKGKKVDWQPQRQSAQL